MGYVCIAVLCVHPFSSFGALWAQGVSYLNLYLCLYLNHYLYLYLNHYLHLYLYLYLCLCPHCGDALCINRALLSPCTRAHPHPFSHSFLFPFPTLWISNIIPKQLKLLEIISLEQHCPFPQQGQCQLLVFLILFSFSHSPNHIFPLPRVSCL